MEAIGGRGEWRGTRVLRAATRIASVTGGRLCFADPYSREDALPRTTAEPQYSTDERELAMLAKALGHPIRLRILSLLAQRASCCTGDLVDDLPLAQSTISQHLKALKDAGLVQGEIQPPRVMYCVNRDAVARAQHLLANVLR